MPQDERRRTRLMRAHLNQLAARELAARLAVKPIARAVGVTAPVIYRFPFVPTATLLTAEEKLEQDYYRALVDSALGKR